jgi:hypothetical protein
LPGDHHAIDFFGWEGFKNRSYSQSLVRVPTAQELNGDFSAPGENTIYDPLTVQPFPGNIIPSSRISATTQTYMKLLFDAPNYTGSSVYNRVNSFPNPTNSNNYSIKIDQHFGQKDTLSLRYTEYNITSLTYQSTVVDLPNVTNDKNLGGIWSHSFTPSLILESHVSWVQLFTNFANQFLISGGAQPIIQ